MDANDPDMSQSQAQDQSQSQRSSVRKKELSLKHGVTMQVVIYSHNFKKCNLSPEAI